MDVSKDGRLGVDRITTHQAQHRAGPRLLSTIAVCGVFTVQVYSEVVPDGRQRPCRRVKDGRLGVDGLITHQGQHRAGAESAIYDSRVGRVQVYSEVVPDGR